MSKLVSYQPVSTYPKDPFGNDIIPKYAPKPFPHLGRTVKVYENNSSTDLYSPVFMESCDSYLYIITNTGGSLYKHSLDTLKEVAYVTSVGASPEYAAPVSTSKGLYVASNYYVRKYSYSTLTYSVVSASFGGFILGLYYYNNAIYVTTNAGIYRLDEDTLVITATLLESGYSDSRGFDELSNGNFAVCRSYSSNTWVEEKNSMTLSHVADITHSYNISSGRTLIINPNTNNCAITNSSGITCFLNAEDKLLGSCSQRKTLDVSGLVSKRVSGIPYTTNPVGVSPSLVKITDNYALGFTYQPSAVSIFVVNIDSGEVIDSIAVSYIPYTSAGSINKRITLSPNKKFAYIYYNTGGSTPASYIIEVPIDWTQIN